MTEKKHQKIIIFAITSAVFIAGFISNITSDATLYQANLKVVPQLQTKGGHALIVFMNIISNLFNPVLCAGYVIIIYLVTSRKLQALTFLIWFIFLSWILSVIKQLVNQPRPFWVSKDIKMLEWTCYIQYGSPSGHSMLAIVLLDFLVRFSSQSIKFIEKHKNIFYVIAGILQGLVMFSRIYLGMHTFNQVLFGLMFGVYSMIPYYFYMEKIIFKYCISILSDKIKLKTIIIMMILTLIFAGFEVLITFAPKYDIDPSWIDNISSISKCNNQYYNGFYLKCFQDEILVVVIPAIMISFKIMTNQTSLLKKFNYSRCSLKFLGYVIITVVFALVPVAIFMNPLWKNIHFESPRSMAVLLWFNNLLAFFLAVTFMVGTSSHLIKYAKLAQYEQVNIIIKRMQMDRQKAGSLILSKKRSDDNIEQELL